MKRIFLIAVIILSVIVMTLSATATEGVSETVTEAITEEKTGSESVTDSVTDSVTESGEEIAEIVEDLEGGLITLEEAILLLAENAGMTPADAEQLIEQLLAWGDTHLANTDWWESFQSSTRENIEFWVMVILSIVAVVAIIGGAVTLFIGVVKRVKRIEYGTGSVMEDSSNNKEAISQTLENIEKRYEDMCERCVVLEEARLKKNEQILALQEELKAMKAKLEKTNKRMLQAEIYNTQAHKLTLERSNLPVTDKSILALWFAKAEASLKEEMSERDLAQVDKIMSTLEEGVADG